MIISYILENFEVRDWNDDGIATTTPAAEAGLTVVGND